MLRAISGLKARLCFIQKKKKSKIAIFLKITNKRLEILQNPINSLHNFLFSLDDTEIFHF